MTRMMAIACSFLIATLLNCSAREPTTDEQADISNKLLEAGYVRWGHMDLTTDWKIEGVYRSNGEICDVRVRATTYDIIDADCD